MYLQKEVDGEIPEGTSEEEKTVVKPLRYSDCSIVGATAKINSDTVLPDSRIKAIPETGAESNSGDITTEWNIDEQDDLFSAVMCSEWQDEETSGDEISKKSLKLGTTRSTFRVIKKFTQAPVEFQEFKNEQLNQLQIALGLNSFAKCTWSFMGANNPKSETVDPISGLENVEYGNALTTKSFKTLEGYMYIGDSFTNMTQCRQSSNFSLTINNNMESTDALFETESIEQSLGDFEVTGDFDVWKAGTFAMNLANDAHDGKEKCLKVALTRTVGDKKYTYEIRLIVHLDEAPEGKDGNKMKNTLKFTIGRVDGLEFIKTVESV